MTSPSPTISIVTLNGDTTGDRLDRFLATHIADISRARIQKLIAQGQVAIGGRTIKEGRYRVKPEDEITLHLPEAQNDDLMGEDIPLDVLFEDNHLIVINKPAGMVVHPAAGNWTGTLVNALIHHCGDSLSGIGGTKRPGIVHRLDKDTTGVMVVAKTDAAHNGLSAQFAAHGRDGRLQRHYLALVWGVPSPVAGRIETTIGRHPSNRLKMAVNRPNGRDAITHYTVLKTPPSHIGEVMVSPAASIVRCVLETGRTHQIRLHMAHIGHPVMGDTVYGSGFKTSAIKLSQAGQNALKTLDRQALHAQKLGFIHPITDEALNFETDLPLDMAHLHSNI